MKKTLLILSLAICGMAHAQPTNFCVTVGDISQNEYGNSIIQSSDGGYVVAGYEGNQSAPNSQDISVVKFNSSGLLQWTKKIGGTGDDWANSVVESNDGGYVMAGGTNSYSAGGSSDVYVVKLDNTGNLLWTKTFGGSYWNGGDVGNSIIKSNDGGYIVAGSTNSYGAGPLGSLDVYILKLDSNGNLQWSKTVGGIGDDVGNSIIQTNDGGYAVAGYTNSYGAGGGDVYIVKLNSAGTLQWTKTVGGSKHDVGNSITQTKDGGYAIAGYTVYDPFDYKNAYIVKLDSNELVQWTKTYGSLNNDDYDECKSIVQSSDGGYIICGNSTYGTVYDGASLVKLNGSGTIQWSHWLYAQENADATCVILLTDGSFAICGTMQPAYYDILLSKITSDGNTCGNSGMPFWGNITSVGISGSGGTVSSGCIVGAGGSVLGTTGKYTNQCPLSVTAATIKPCYASCNGTATANPQGGFWPYTYLWSNGQTTQTATGLCASANSYTVTVKDTTTASASTTFYLSSSTPLSVSPYPYSSSTICSGRCDTLIANPHGGSGAYTYLWSPGNMTTSWISVCPSTTSTYSVMLTDVCGSDSGATTVTVNSSPTISAGNNVTICAGQTATLCGSGGVGYSWNTSATTSCIAVSPTASSTYSVIGMNTNGCTNSNSVTVTVQTCLGINENSNSNGIIISPNPTSGMFTIQSSVNISQIEIVNLLGEKIFSKQINSAQTEIDLSKERNGIYFLQLKTEQGIATKKIVIQ